MGVELRWDVEASTQGQNTRTQTGMAMVVSMTMFDPKSLHTHPHNSSE